MTGHKIDFIALRPPQDKLVNQPLPQMRGHVLHISSWAICRLDRFKPMKYRHRIPRNGWWSNTVPAKSRASVRALATAACHQNPAWRTTVRTHDAMSARTVSKQSS